MKSLNIAFLFSILFFLMSKLVYASSAIETHTAESVWQATYVKSDSPSVRFAPRRLDSYKESYKLDELIDLSLAQPNNISTTGLSIRYQNSSKTWSRADSDNAPRLTNEQLGNLKLKLGWE